jgi:phosphate starvation-inducible PhoH-like protein
VSTSPRLEDAKTMRLEFDDNQLLVQLFGSHNSHLTRIEQFLEVSLNSRGNAVTVSGPGDAAKAASAVLKGLYARLKKGHEVDVQEVDAALRMAATGGDQRTSPVDLDELVVRTRKRRITPRSPRQADYLRALGSHDLVFGLGPAGTGKTYLAVAKAVEMLVKGEIDRIVLSRPAVEAGEQLGFLPGDMRDKVDPYLRPLYDALYDMLPADQVTKKMETGEIEIAPLAFMRGRTLADAFVILDEAQNTTPVQMKMFLTRLGENARMVVTGDLSQIDLPRGVRCGLLDAVEVLNGVGGVTFIRFGEEDVVRHHLVARIVHAYGERDAAARNGDGKDAPHD